VQRAIELCRSKISATSPASLSSVFRLNTDHAVLSRYKTQAHAAIPARQVIPSNANIGHIPPTAYSCCSSSFWVVLPVGSICTLPSILVQRIRRDKQNTYRAEYRVRRKSAPRIVVSNCNTPDF
jgi:hypothetical protein